LYDEQSRQKREEEYNKKESDLSQRAARQAWKKDHPNTTLKHYKTLYIHGMIDKLPWEDYSPGTYKQNEEQNENTLFQKIKSIKRE
jgi:hypothetical protein